MNTKQKSRNKNMLSRCFVTRKQVTGFLAAWKGQQESKEGEEEGSQGGQQKSIRA